MNEHDTVGLYVVDALDQQEASAFEVHLAGCESCQREVTDMSESLAQLSELTAVAPPLELRGSILAAVQAEGRASLSAVDPVARKKGSSTSPVGALSDRPQQTSAERPAFQQAPTVQLGEQSRPVPRGPDELALRRSRRTVRGLVVGIAASLVLAVGAGGFAQTVRANSDRQAEQAVSQASLWAAPDLIVKHVTLANGSGANYAVSQQQSRAMFIAESMPAIQPGQVFQMWTIRTEGGAAVARPSVTFDGNGPVTVTFDDLTDAEVLAITVEPEGGSAAPTTAPFAEAAL